MTQDKSKIMEKIRKLLALSESPNEHEAALAAEKAQALLAEHNLSMTEFEIQKDTDNIMEDAGFRTESRPWARGMVGAVARLYFCSYFYRFVKVQNLNKQCGYDRYDAHCFIGAPHNIVVAKMMAEYLYQTVERLAKEAAAKHPVRNRGSFETAFKLGCAQRVSQRIKKRMEDTMRGQSTTDGSNLPALLNLYEQAKAVNQAFIDAKVGKLGNARKTKVMNPAGYWQGHAAGDKVGLDQQVHGKAAAHMLPSKK